MTDVKKAAKTIVRFASQPEIDNGQWGTEGVKPARASLIYPREKRTGRNGKTRWVGGRKNWRWDVRMSWSHVWKAIRPGKLRQGFLFDSRRQHLYQAWFYLRHANELNTPDGVVSGTSLYGVWIEEAWHAAIWSPDVAKAAAALLRVSEGAEADELARLVLVQAERLRKAEA